MFLLRKLRKFLNKQIMKKLLFLLAIFALNFSNAKASPIVVYDDLQVTTSDLGQRTYSVTFGDEKKCPSLSLCKPFLFTNSYDAFAAADALAARIAKDTRGLHGAPYLADGCSSQFRCVMMIPFGPLIPLYDDRFYFWAAVVENNNYGPGGIFQYTRPASIDTIEEALIHDEYTYATLSLNDANEVPEPGTVSLMSLAMMLVYVIRNRQVRR